MAFSLTMMMEEAVQIILQLREGDVSQKMLAIQAAGIYVERRSYFPEALPLLLKFLEQEQHSGLAAEAAWNLWKFKEPQAVPLLLKKARESKFVGVREKALRALGLLTAKTALPLLHEIVSGNGHFTPQEHAAAIFALGFFKETRHFKILRRALGHRFPEVRQEAIASFVRFCREDPANFLSFLRRKIACRTSPWFEKCGSVRAEALSGIVWLDPERARRIVTKACLKDPSDLVRAKSFALLKDWIGLETEQLALLGLQDISWKVRAAAYRLLRQAIAENKVWDRVKVSEALAVAKEVLPRYLRSEGGVL